ncbi:4'-phosphopantetheinyl transferase family protein [Neosynechococcus sphagnicola]|uniref:4'-phosphopantetheinyl transferase family protein n=1 Tax=Neosynechococcus sphagnicola TaxID=1501145 RepID=UPI0012E0404B|nr:4'-phosphopantetheinyl transferase superfamily protein [Neosynechococcus sphagnicola]
MTKFIFPIDGYSASAPSKTEQWLLAPVTPELPRQQVHLWQADLVVPMAELQVLSSLLSMEENRRADRLRLELHRQRFIAARGYLRVILSRYLDLLPGQLIFTYGAHGKPILETTFSAGRLEFNLSHSHDLCTYAIALDMQVGIDLEYRRPINNVEQLAQRFFSPSEYEQLQSRTPEQRLDCFLQIWTLKEAYLKGTGWGLAGLPEVQVAWAGEAVTGLVLAESGLQWWMHQFQPQPSYLGALVVQSLSPPHLQCWRLVGPLRNS